MNATNRPSQDLGSPSWVYEKGQLPQEVPCRALSSALVAILLLSFVLLDIKRWRGEGAPTTYSAVLNEVESETQDTALN